MIFCMHLSYLELKMKNAENFDLVMCFHFQHLPRKVGVRKLILKFLD